jgi:hypothetical protein
MLPVLIPKCDDANLTRLTHYPQLNALASYHLTTQKHMLYTEWTRYGIPLISLAVLITAGAATIMALQTVRHTTLLKPLGSTCKLRDLTTLLQCRKYSLYRVMGTFRTAGEALICDHLPLAFIRNPITTVVNSLT